MSLLQAALLGVLQGLTEFLPVSSSGHLVLGQAVLGIELPGVAFEVTVHLATLLAVVWVYRARVGELAAGVVRGRRAALAYTGLLALASLPAAAAGLGAESFFEAMFGRPVWAAGFLLVTGAIVWSVRATGPRAGDPEPGPSRAFAIGVAQAAAILPGISRSGATVAAGTALGIEPGRAAEFSFLLSVPAILGAGLLQAGEIGATAGSTGAAPLAVAFVAALVAGVAAIRLFLRMLRARTFHRFAWYCWAAGASYLVGAALLPGLR